MIRTQNIWSESRIRAFIIKLLPCHHDFMGRKFLGMMISIR